MSMRNDPSRKDLLYVPNANQDVACVDDTANTAGPGRNFHSPWSAKSAGKFQWAWFQYVYFIPRPFRVHEARVVMDGGGSDFGICWRDTGRAGIVDKSGSVLYCNNNDS